MGPDDQVECIPFAAKIPARVCVLRHLAREPSGAGKDWPIFPPCAACATGAARADELVRVGYRPRAFRVDPRRLKKQRTAMWRASLEAPSYRPPTIDAPPGEG